MKKHLSILRTRVCEDPVLDNYQGRILFGSTED
jgi:hypothetical protein